MTSTASEGPAPLSPVLPAEPIAPWLGGKRFLAKRIIERIEAIPHRCYAEPFVGMGGVLLRRRTRSKSEVINDRNREIVNLFRIVREHPEELGRQFEWLLASRAEFARALAIAPELLTDVQRAARFAFLQRLTFGGQPAHLSSQGNFGVNTHYRARMRTRHLQRLVRAAHRRLEGVHVECLEWAEFIRRFDGPATLFYIDPPYWGHEQDYGRGLFSRADFAHMAKLLRALKGQFILSLNDRPEVRELFEGFEFQEVQTTYTTNARAARRARELLIDGGR